MDWCKWGSLSSAVTVSAVDSVLGGGADGRDIVVWGVIIMEVGV